MHTIAFYETMNFSYAWCCFAVSRPFFILSKSGHGPNFTTLLRGPSPFTGSLPVVNIYFLYHIITLTHTRRRRNETLEPLLDNF